MYLYMHTYKHAYMHAYIHSLTHLYVFCTMQVFVNGVEQKVAIASIPVQGPLYYFVELLSDSQEIRIRPGARPPLHPNVFTRAV